MYLTKLLAIFFLSFDLPSTLGLLFELDMYRLSILPPPTRVPHLVHPSWMEHSPFGGITLLIISSFKNHFGITHLDNFLPHLVSLLFLSFLLLFILVYHPLVLVKTKFQHGYQDKKWHTHMNNRQNLKNQQQMF